MLWTIASFFLFTLLVAAIAYRKTRRDLMVTADAYFLGRRSLTAAVIAGSLILTNLSTEHLMGLNGDAFNHSIGVAARETTAALAMVLTALHLLPRYLKSGFSTTPELLAFVFLLTVAIMLLLSCFKPHDRVYNQYQIGHVDITPWRHAGPVAALVPSPPSTCYVVLAQ